MEEFKTKTFASVLSTDSFIFYFNMKGTMEMTSNVPEHIVDKHFKRHFNLKKVADQYQNLAKYDFDD